MNEAILHLRTDLIESGMTSDDVAAVEQSYERALRAPSEGTWQEFYEEVITALSRMCARPRRLNKRTRRATESLLRLIEDDLGSELVDAPLAVQLRLMLTAPARSPHRPGAAGGSR